MNDESSNIKSEDKLESVAGRYLSFSLASEKFAIPLLQVKEVIGDAQAIPIPQSQPYFKGIINLRGQVISIIDLRAKLKLEKISTKSSESTIIIMNFAGLSIGVVVDSVDCVSVFSDKDISNSPDVDGDSQTSYITGVARQDKNLTLILDLRAMLNVDDYQTIKNQSPKAS